MSRPESGPPDPQSLGPLPRGPDGEPVFSAPWEAQAFAMAVALHARGLFTWTEWAAALGREIAAGCKEPEAQTSSHFYEHWLAALENLVRDKGVAGDGRLESLRDAFARAARATPHGAPVLLANDPMGATASRGQAPGPSRPLPWRAETSI